MSSIYVDQRRVVVSVTMSKGTDISTWSFPDGYPSKETLSQILSAIIDGYTLEETETIPIHQVEP